MDLADQRSSLLQGTKLVIVYIEDEGKKQGYYWRMYFEFGLYSIVVESEDDYVEEEHNKIDEK